VFLVAIVDVEHIPDAARAPLAVALGTTLYELRLVLSAGLPAVVLTTPEASRAEAAVQLIEREAGRAVWGERRAVYPSARMPAIRDFRFQPSGLTLTETGAELLPFSDIFAIIRATHSTVTTSSTVVKERKLDPGMAIITGGLKMSKTTSRDVVSRTDNRQQVLYLFRISGAPPWLLREQSAHYAGLGNALGPSSLGNFREVVRALRERVPNAAYDERFLAHRALRGISDGIEATDILVHLLALSLGYQPNC